MPELKITIAISAGQNEALCRRLIASLERQTLSENLQILISAPEPGESLSRARNRMYAEARAPYVFFLDEDCELPDTRYLERLLARLEREGGAVGGGYLGGGGLWQTAYNALTSYWLDLHARLGQGLPVAGNFAMPRVPGTGQGFPFPLDVHFGGEEIRLRQALLAIGMKFTLAPDLSVLHNSSKTAEGFFRRAWTHGQAPRMPARRREALRGLGRSFETVRDFRIRTLMLAYLATVMTARMTCYLLPKKTA